MLWVEHPSFLQSAFDVLGTHVETGKSDEAICTVSGSSDVLEPSKVCSRLGRAIDGLIWRWGCCWNHTLLEERCAVKSHEVY